jgi:hypothetical protein
MLHSFLLSRCWDMTKWLTSQNGCFRYEQSSIICGSLLLKAARLWPSPLSPTFSNTLEGPQSPVTPVVLNLIFLINRLVVAQTFQPHHKIEYIKLIKSYIYISQKKSSMTYSHFLKRLNPWISADLPWPFRHGPMAIPHLQGHAASRFSQAKGRTAQFGRIEGSKF